jgi:hypothetical protein
MIKWIETLSMHLEGGIMAIKIMAHTDTENFPLAMSFAVKDCPDLCKIVDEIDHRVRAVVGKRLGVEPPAPPAANA